MFSFIGTPIGNMQDISVRAAETLLAADLVYAEDTRSYLRLRDRLFDMFEVELNPDQVVKALHKDNEFALIHEVLDVAQSEKSAVYISDSGMPIISDPGALLVQTLHKHEVKFDVIPGPTALTTALAHYPRAWKQAHFIGFFPKKMSHVTRMVKEFATLPHVDDVVFVAYVSPHNFAEVVETLFLQEEVKEIFLARELTKMHQETVMITPQSELAKLRGECVILWQFSVKNNIRTL